MAVVSLDAKTLPWYLIGVLVAALLSVVTGLITGKLLSSKVANWLVERADKRTEDVRALLAEELAAADEDRKTQRALVDSVGKLLVSAENQERVLSALQAAYARDENAQRRGV
jgi:hypothetical protein